MDNSVIVYKLGSESDVFFYVVGSSDEVKLFRNVLLLPAASCAPQNELILQAVLDAFTKALTSLLKYASNYSRTPDWSFTPSTFAGATRINHPFWSTTSCSCCASTRQWTRGESPAPAALQHTVTLPSAELFSKPTQLLWKSVCAWRVPCLRALAPTVK